MEARSDQSKVKLIECPRDAMQGWSNFIPTQKKAAYLNALLQVGFDTLDFGSFVSPKAIPQMIDTAEVLSMLDMGGISTRLLAIVANERGAREAVAFEKITFLGYPFSISETFQKRNTNKTVAASFDLVQRIQELCVIHNKKLVIYISMGFGNPYGDAYDELIVGEWVEKFAAMGIEIISLADTVGLADPKTISRLFSYLIPAYRQVEFGAHFHSTPAGRSEKIGAALDNGCCRFDSAIKGFGGCPMAEDELVGNMATEFLLDYLEEKNTGIDYDKNAFMRAMMLAAEVFV